VIKIELEESNTHEIAYKNIRVGVYWNDFGFPDRKFSGWSKGVERIADGETENIVKRVVTLNCFAFCKFL
jgi:hypothetical protein